MLEGDLSDFTLPEILKLLAFTSKTGRLHLRHDDTLGRIEVGAGRVQAASADAARLPLAGRLVGRGLLDTDTLHELIGGRDALPTDLELAQALVDADTAPASCVAEAVQAQSVDAVFDLLRWTEGRFRFAAEDVASTGPLAVEHDLDELLEQAQQRLERWPDIRERTGPGDATVSVTSPADTSVEIDADAWQLIGLADGSRTIDELARLTGRGQFDTRSTLVELADRGLVAFGTDERDGALERLLRAQTTLGELEERLRAAVDATGRRDASADTARTDTSPADTSPADTSPADTSPADTSPADTTPGHPDARDPDEVREPDTFVAEFDLDALDEMVDTDGTVDEDTVVAEAEVRAGGANAATVPGPPGRPNGPTPATAGPLSRRPRLRTDPTVDPALVDRLIDGVRNLA